jgi:hypothetical protein
MCPFKFLCKPHSKLANNMSCRQLSFVAVPITLRESFKVTACVVQESKRLLGDRTALDSNLNPI